ANASDKLEAKANAGPMALPADVGGQGFGSGGHGAPMGGDIAATPAASAAARAPAKRAIDTEAPFAGGGGRGEGGDPRTTPATPAPPPPPAAPTAAAEKEKGALGKAAAPSSRVARGWDDVPSFRPRGGARRMIPMRRVFDRHVGFDLTNAF